MPTKLFADAALLAAWNRHAPGQRLPGQQVDVEMRHFLPAMLADIGDGTVAWRLQPKLPRDEADGAEESRNLGIGGIEREIGIHPPCNRCLWE